MILEKYAYGQGIQQILTKIRGFPPIQSRAGYSRKVNKTVKLKTSSSTNNVGPKCLELTLDIILSSMFYKHRVCYIQFSVSSNETLIRNKAQYI